MGEGTSQPLIDWLISRWRVRGTLPGDITDETVVEEGGHTDARDHVYSLDPIAAELHAPKLKEDGTVLSGNDANDPVSRDSRNRHALYERNLLILLKEHLSDDLHPTDLQVRLIRELVTSVSQSRAQRPLNPYRALNSSQSLNQAVLNAQLRNLDALSAHATRASSGFFRPTLYAGLGRSGVLG